MSNASTRIWDLPTRLFHWLLAACVIALVVTAKVGGNAMEWHLRLGHVVLALLVFRILWGVVGGHWSRFATFIPGPARLLRYLRQPAADTTVGHNPLGALSVLALLLVLGLQVGTGLLSDDEIAFAGPLTRFVSGDTVAWATGWHKDWGQWLLLGLLALHLCAVAFYAVVRRKPLVQAMLHGNQTAPAGTTASRDGLAARLLALLLIAACAAAAWWVYGLGSTPGF
ncbi:cytochrome b/b6 domain-containing protein [Comamonas terrigena]|uniref:cytochrome b/b6 domain-containing protein n=1 Tax=Comamonas terrigena TaxID=32013 RepID=UPI002448EEB4|nr:cytochrome b/b6 domain-containing protein [Comamonas terrigena]MDH1703099.1 cytochrome b/b6 domain-containing protein [Comamonas terrigena]